MSRLEELGIVNLVWSEDEDGNVFAEGLQEYEIDVNYELAVFHGPKCIKVTECVDLTHAVSVVYAGEGVCRWNLKMGKTWRGNAINGKGWDIGKRVQA